jgi:hypothetical protein
LGYDGTQNPGFFEHATEAESTFHALEGLVMALQPGAMLASACGGAALLLWRYVQRNEFRVGAIPGPLVAVVVSARGHGYDSLGGKLAAFLTQKPLAADIYEFEFPALHFPVWGIEPTSWCDAEAHGNSTLTTGPRIA